LRLLPPEAHDRARRAFAGLNAPRGSRLQLALIVLTLVSMVVIATLLVVPSRAVLG